MSSSSLPRLTRRKSLAPTQAKDERLDSEEDSASLLMDMSLTDLKLSPQKRKKSRRQQVTEDVLDKLSQEELEQLAWEVVEEENRLQVRRSTRRSSVTAEEPTKNVTVRRKSNTPRRSMKASVEGKSLTVEEERNYDASECFAPLPKSTSTSPVKHSYDRQASPSRSALKRPQVRKSVAFGEIAEYDISSGGPEEALSTSDTTQRAETSSSSQAAPSEVRSSSPLSRFNGAAAAALPVAKVVVKAKKAPRDSVRRSSLRGKQARVSDGAEVARKTTSTKSPIAKTRLREAIQNSSAKSRLKARESAVKAKARAREEIKIPSGFRLSSTGTLIAQTKCTPFSVAVVKTTSRGRRSITTTAAVPSSKANPVPAWLKRRKEALRKEEDERLQKEIERVRAQELAVEQSEEKVVGKKVKRLPSAAKPGYTSAVDKRIAERAAWEAKRKANESILQQEKEKARQQREEREAEEYRLARQKSVPKANPVPDFIRARARK